MSNRRSAGRKHDLNNFFRGGESRLDPDADLDNG
jgi:hypothetical protein